jgi:hypothetical protein
MSRLAAVQLELDQARAAAAVADEEGNEEEEERLRVVIKKLKEEKKQMNDDGRFSKKKIKEKKKGRLGHATPAVAIEMTVPSSATKTQSNPMAHPTEAPPQRKNSVFIDFTDTSSYDLSQHQHGTQTQTGNPLRPVRRDDHQPFFVGEAYQKSKPRSRCKKLFGVVILILVAAGIAGFILMRGAAGGAGGGTTSSGPAPAPDSTNDGDASSGGTTVKPGDTPPPPPPPSSPCDGIECAHGGTCTALDSPGVGYQCSACSDGYVGGANTVCVNVNECTISSSSSQHNCHLHASCVDTPGSFKCSCNSGYSGNGVICGESPSADSSDQKVVSSSASLSGLTVEQFNADHSQLAFRRAVAQYVSVRTAFILSYSFKMFLFFF